MVLEKAGFSLIGKGPLFLALLVFNKPVKAIKKKKKNGIGAEVFCFSHQIFNTEIFVGPKKRCFLSLCFKKKNPLNKKTVREKNVKKPTLRGERGKKSEKKIIDPSDCF